MLELVLKDDLEDELEILLELGKPFAAALGADELAEDDNDLGAHLIDALEQLLEGNLLTHLVELDLADDDECGFGATVLLFRLDLLRV